MRPIAEFLGVGVHTIYRLFEGRNALIGEVAIRFTCYLETQGYKIIEFERLPTPVRNFAELIGFRVLSAQEATKLLGFHENSTMYRLFQDKADTTRDKKNLMLDVWKERRNDLERRKKEVPQLFSVSKPQKSFDVAVIKKNGSITQRKIAVSMMQVMLDLFEEGLFDSFSCEELERLGADCKSIFRLSAYLNSLSLRLTSTGGEHG